MKSCRRLWQAPLAKGLCNDRNLLWGRGWFTACVLVLSGSSDQRKSDAKVRRWRRRRFEKVKALTSKRYSARNWKPPVPKTSWEDFGQEVAKVLATTKEWRLREGGGKKLQLKVWREFTLPWARSEDQTTLTITKWRKVNYTSKSTQWISRVISSKHYRQHNEQKVVQWPTLREYLAIRTQSCTIARQLWHYILTLNSLLCRFNVSIRQNNNTRKGVSYHVVINHVMRLNIWPKKWPGFLFLLSSRSS